MRKIIFSWMLLFCSFAPTSTGCIIQGTKSGSNTQSEAINDKIFDLFHSFHSENSDENLPGSTENAATGCDDAATFDVINSLSGCLSPVAGNFYQKSAPIDTHFQVVWQTPFSPMTIFILMAKINYSDLLPGDEIGIFDNDPISGNEICVGAGVLVEVLNGTNYLEIIASMDDGSLPGQANGFTAGNPIIYKFWTEETGEISGVNPNYPYPGYDMVFTPLGTAFTELSIMMEITQTINLQTGWNIMSFRVQPQETDMLSVVQPLISQGILFKVIDEKGGSIFQLPFHEPFGQWANTIGNMSNTEGYYIKTTADGDLPLTGIPVDLPFEIPLSEGWNIIGYPCTFTQNAEMAFLPLIEAGVFSKAMDEKGRMVCHLPFPLPDGQWINTMGDLETGEGYYLKVTEETTLSFNEQEFLSKTSLKNIQNHVPGFFNPVWENNPFMPMHIALEANEELTSGDEIGIFDGEVCVGTTVFDGNIDNPLIVVCSMDDPDTEIADGFTVGNEIVFKVWDFETQTLLDQPLIEFLEGQTVFTSLETFAGRIISLTTNIFENSDCDLSLEVISNPLNHAAIIEVNIPETGTLSFFICDLSGRPVGEPVKLNSTNGRWRIPMINFASCPGVYLLHYEYFYQDKIIKGSHKIIQLK